jgi:elongation factor P
MSIPATQIRRGMTIIFDGEPCRVIEFNHHTPGNLRAMVHAKMKKLKTGTNVEHRFRASDQIDTASMETHQLEFMYRGGDVFHFMNAETFDQYELDEEALGDATPWISEGMRIVAEFFEGRPVAIDLPNALTFEITETSPVMRGATKTSSNKPATLSNGVSITVPEHLSVGDRVRVNPNTSEYIDRAKD